jgi:hypothetical protein
MPATRPDSYNFHHRRFVGNPHRLAVRRTQCFTHREPSTACSGQLPFAHLRIGFISVV